MPPEFTPNLNLAKPDLDDQYNVAIWNSNSDKIDEFAGLIPPRALTADKLKPGANINGVLFTGERDVVTGWGWYYPTVVYSQNNIVFTVLGNEVKVKRSLKDNNVGHSLEDTEWWLDVEIGGGGSSTTNYEDVGTIKFSLTPLRSESLHRLDGSIITEIPADFLDYINWLRSNAPNCFASSESYNSDMSLYGECGHFVYDTEYNTIKLPTIRGIVQGTNALDALGNIIQAGLPSHSHTGSSTSAGAHTHTRGTMNITGTFAGVGEYYRGSNLGGVVSGAFYRVNKSSNPSGGAPVSTGAGVIRDDVFGLDASSNWTGSTSSAGSHSHSLSIGSASYSGNIINSDTVQPQTIQGLYYIVYTNLGVTQDTFIQIVENKADKSYVDNKMAIADQTYAKKEDIGNVYTPKGNVNTYGDLPSLNSAKIGDVYNVLDTGKNYVCALNTLDEKFWDDLGGNIDFSNYYTKQQVYNKSEIDTKLLEIETGQLDITSQISSVVDNKFIFSNGLNVLRNLKTTVSVSSSTTDLQVTSSYEGTQSSEGTISYEFVYNGSDWTLNEQIVDLNTFYLTVEGEPTEGDKITLVYTTIYIDTISTEFDGDFDNLTNKPDIPLVDDVYNASSSNAQSGIAVADAISSITASSIGALPDTTVIPIVTNTYSSTSLDAMSGVAVANAISTKEDKNVAINTLASSGTINLVDNSINTISPSDAIVFVLPQVANTSVFHQIFVQLNMASAVSITLGTSKIIGSMPVLSAGGKFNIIYEYRNDLLDWTVGVVAITG